MIAWQSLKGVVADRVTCLQQSTSTSLLDACSYSDILYWVVVHDEENGKYKLSLVPHTDPVVKCFCESFTSIKQSNEDWMEHTCCCQCLGWNYGNSAHVDVCTSFLSV